MHGAMLKPRNACRNESLSYPLSPIKAEAFLGAESSPAFVRAPESNGCAERFIRSLKEHLLWVRWFGTVEELRQVLLQFQRT